MGPERDDAPLEYKSQSIAQVKTAVKKSVEKYFSDPLHYIFYGSLTVLIIALFFGIHFSWQLYLIIVILAGIKLFNHFKKS
jgi:small basic protein